MRSYHIAEHHSTPLGMAPSPSVFLAAVAQRTKRLRFNRSLLYVTPMYHPLRVAEEVVMLDSIDRGILNWASAAAPRQSKSPVSGSIRPKRPK